MDNAGTAKSGIFDEERFCIGCGYNLRTLHRSAKCPECGRAVLDSLGRNLYSADRVWLISIRRGMIFLSLHIVAMVGAGFLRFNRSALALIYLVAPAGPKSAILIDLRRTGAFLMALTIVAILLYGAGIWFFSRSGAIEPLKSTETNAILRWTGVSWVAMGLLSFPFMWFPIQLGDGWLLTMAALAAELLLIVLTYWRLANLADLADATRLARFTRWMFAVHIIAMMSALIAGSFSRVIAVMVLTPVSAAGWILWVIYFQMLSRALRRS